MAFQLTLEGRVHTISILRRRPHLVLAIDGREHVVSAMGEAADGRRTVEIAGVIHSFARARTGDRQIVRWAGAHHEIDLVDPFSRAGGESGRDEVKAPMPGRIVAIHKLVGDDVKRGEAVMTIESMKLQMALTAPRDGVISVLSRAGGETVEKDEIVARLIALASES